MNSLHKVAVLAVVVASLGSIGIGAALQQQAFAQGVIVDYKEFTKLTNEFEEAVLDAAAVDPPDPDRIQNLLDEYNRNVAVIFELEPPDPDADSPTEGDPPSEVDPPDPDTEPPDPDTEPPTR